MAESLNAEQLAERRSNLQAFRALLDMEDDSELTTTLLMQEEWLATVDELQEYARDAHIIRGLRTRKCLTSSFINEMGEDDYDCTNFWRDNRLYCAPCYLRSILKPDLPAEEPADTDELLRRHWQPGAFDPEGEDVTEGWPEEEAWREHFEAPPPPDITEFDLHSISLHTDPPDPRDATPEGFERGSITPEEALKLMSEPPTPTECDINGHVWVKLGKVGFGDKGLSAVDWGDAQCLRCHIPVPGPDFDEDDDEEFFTRL